MNDIIIVIGIMLLMFIFVRSIDKDTYDDIGREAMNSALAVLFILGVSAIYIGATNNGIKEGVKKAAKEKIETNNDSINTFKNKKI